MMYYEEFKLQGGLKITTLYERVKSVISTDSSIKNLHVLNLVKLKTVIFLQS